jgi:hypothetical protein
MLKQLAAVSLGLAVLAGCGQGTDARPESAPAGKSVRVDPATLQQAFLGLKYDFTPIKSYGQLKKKATLVGIGRIEQVLPGRIEGATSSDDPFALRTSAVQLSMINVSKGSVAVGDSIWLELPVQPERLQTGLLPGLDVAVFLVGAAPDDGPLVYGGEGSAVPDDAQLWRLAHPQGLMVQYDASGGTAVPLSDTVDPEGDLESIAAVSE